MGFQASLTILYVEFCVCIEADSLFRQVVMWENNTAFKVPRGVLFFEYTIGVLCLLWAFHSRARTVRLVTKIRKLLKNS